MIQEKDIFNVSTKDSILITGIAKRAIELGCRVGLMTIRMDLTAAHHTNNLNLEKLMDFTEPDLMHDIYGINQYLAHDTGQLTHNFWPRCGSRK